MNKKLLVILLTIFSVSMLFGVQKTAQTKSNSKTVITGYIVSKGNVPFTYPAIRTEDGTEYIITCKNSTKKKLLNAQGQLIKFTGKIDDGFFILKKWKIVK